MLELDAEGAVLYARAERDGEGKQASFDLAGRNFYSGSAPFKNVEEFRHLLDRFAMSSDDAGSFKFVCKYEDSDVPVRVLLARIRERSDGNRTKAILVHIRKAS